MNKEATLLFVDDEENILSSLKRLMRRTPYECHFANSGANALKLLEKEAIDVIVSDMKMPGMTGAELLSEVAERYPETMRIVLSGYAEQATIMEAINAGRIWGFIHKPWSDADLKQIIEHAVFTQQVIAERALLRHTVAQYRATYKESFADFIGNSVAMQLIYNCIEKAAPSKASVFITGESGTGKELVARAIHSNSTRANGPFVALNCAAIPNDLIESEVFGHIKGAFSGAVSARDGAATLADGGTLFLDELAEMDINLQAKLLRFIQTGTFQRVGSSKSESVDIRFVCATNQDPHKAIEEKTLREDLYYRLNVVSIELPPLRDRDKDSLLLAKAFLERFAKEEDQVVVGFSTDAEHLINHYNWPGNVRQLENTIHSAVIMSQGPLVTAQDLATILRIDLNALTTQKNSLPVKQIQTPTAPTPINQSNLPSSSAPSALPQHTDAVDHTILPLSKVEESAIKRALELCEANVVKAASLLGVSPSTLYRKIQNWEQSS